MQKLLISIACSASLFASACSSIHLPWVYRINVQQGNVISQEEIDQLKPGMTKRQVNYVMGTPILTDVFHQDRWDYVYRMQPGFGKPTEQHVTLYFDQDQLARIAGDFRPNPQAAPAPRHEVTVTVPPRPPRKGFLRRLWDNLRDKSEY